MATVEQLLKNKGPSVWTIEPGATVYEALKVMADRNVGALVVVRKDKVVGVFSERDYARKIILQDRLSKKTRVEEIMTDRVLAVSPRETTEQALALMTREHHRHLPVLEDGRLVGIVSIGDVVAAIISHQTFVIEQLENYIVPGWK